MRWSRGGSTDPQPYLIPTRLSSSLLAGFLCRFPTLSGLGRPFHQKNVPQLLRGRCGGMPAAVDFLSLDLLAYVVRYPVIGPL